MPRGHGLGVVLVVLAAVAAATSASATSLRHDRRLTQCVDHTFLSAPFGLAFDNDGLLYVAQERGTNDGFPFGDSIARLAVGTGAPPPCEHSEPIEGAGALAFDSDCNLYATDDNACLWKVAADGTKTQSITCGTNGLNNPNGIAIDSADDLYVVNAGSGELWKFHHGFTNYEDDPNACVLSTGSSTQNVQGVTVDEGRGVVYVSDSLFGIYAVPSTCNTLPHCDVSGPMSAPCQLIADLSSTAIPNHVVDWGMSHEGGLLYDEPTDTLYWSDYGQGLVISLGLSGPVGSVVATAPAVCVEGIPQARGLAKHPITGKLWVSSYEEWPGMGAGLGHLPEDGGAVYEFEQCPGGVANPSTSPTQQNPSQCSTGTCAAPAPVPASCPAPTTPTTPTGTTTASGVCIDFENPPWGPVGTSWSSATNAPGDVIVTQHNVDVSVHVFSTSTSLNVASITATTASFGTDAQTMNTNNINLGFDLGGTSICPSGQSVVEFSFEYEDLGGHTNMEIGANGGSTGLVQRNDIVDYVGAMGANVIMCDPPVAVPGGHKGKCTVEVPSGSFDKFLIGGQEFTIDQVCIECAVPTTDSPPTSTTTTTPGTTTTGQCQPSTWDATTTATHPLLRCNDVSGHSWPCGGDSLVAGDVQLSSGAISVDLDGASTYNLYELWFIPSLSTTMTIANMEYAGTFATDGSGDTGSHSGFWDGKVRRASSHTASVTADWVESSGTQSTTSDVLSALGLTSATGHWVVFSRGPYRTASTYNTVTSGTDSSAGASTTNLANPQTADGSLLVQFISCEAPTTGTAATVPTTTTTTNTGGGAAWNPDNKCPWVIVPADDSSKHTFALSRCQDVQRIGYLGCGSDVLGSGSDVVVDYGVSSLGAVSVDINGAEPHTFYELWFFPYPMPNMPQMAIAKYVGAFATDYGGMAGKYSGGFTGAVRAAASASAMLSADFIESSGPQADVSGLPTSPADGHFVILSRGTYRTMTTYHTVNDVNDASATASTTSLANVPLSSSQFQNDAQFVTCSSGSSTPAPVCDGFASSPMGVVHIPSIDHGATISPTDDASSFSLAATVKVPAVINRAVKLGLRGSVSGCEVDLPADSWHERAGGSVTDASSGDCNSFFDIFTELWAHPSCHPEQTGTVSGIGPSSEDFDVHGFELVVTIEDELSLSRAGSQKATYRHAYPFEIRTQKVAKVKGGASTSLSISSEDLPGVIHEAFIKAYERRDEVLATVTLVASVQDPYRLPTDSSIIDVGDLPGGITTTVEGVTEECVGDSSAGANDAHCSYAILIYLHGCPVDGSIDVKMPVSCKAGETAASCASLQDIVATITINEKPDVCSASQHDQEFEATLALTSGATSITGSADVTFDAAMHPKGDTSASVKSKLDAVTLLVGCDCTAANPACDASDSAYNAITLAGQAAVDHAFVHAGTSALLQQFQFTADATQLGLGAGESTDLCVEAALTYTGLERSRRLVRTRARVLAFAPDGADVYGHQTLALEADKTKSVVKVAAKVSGVTREVLDQPKMRAAAVSVLAKSVGVDPKLVRIVAIRWVTEEVPDRELRGRALRTITYAVIDFVVEVPKDRKVDEVAQRVKDVFEAAPASSGSGSGAAAASGLSVFATAFKEETGVEVTVTATVEERAAIAAPPAAAPPAKQDDNKMLFIGAGAAVLIIAVVGASAYAMGRRNSVKVVPQQLSMNTTGGSSTPRGSPRLSSAANAYVVDVSPTARTKTVDATGTEAGSTDGDEIASGGPGSSTSGDVSTLPLALPIGRVSPALPPIGATDEQKAPADPSQLAPVRGPATLLATPPRLAAVGTHNPDLRVSNRNVLARVRLEPISASPSRTTTPVSEVDEGR